jgi:hypothetical protein
LSRVVVELLLKTIANFGQERQKRVNVERSARQDLAGSEAARAIIQVELDQSDQILAAIFPIASRL